MEKMNPRLLELNKMLNENDVLYQEMAKTFGMSNCMLGVLYAVRMHQNAATKEIIRTTSYHDEERVEKTLKEMVEKGYLQIEGEEVSLTRKGRDLARKTIDLIILCENEALEDLSEKEHRTFTMLIRRYTSLLRHSLEEVKRNDR